MNEFSHQQHAHCESGALSVLLTHYGLSISEPMIFGITSSLSFVFLPVVKLNNMPLISYRDMPRNMVKKLPKILNMEMAQKRYDDPHAADRELTELLNAGKLVGLQTSVYYLPYFPKDMRFHFNAHNLVVCQKQDDNYLISDPVFEDLQWCDARGLTKARFAKGV
ncbi:MAG: peptidase, partial [Deltaproteobacteria bacterium]